MFYQVQRIFFSLLLLAVTSSAISGVVTNGQTITGISGGNNYYSIYVGKDATSLTITVNGTNLQPSQLALFASRGQSQVTAATSQYRGQNFSSKTTGGLGVRIVIDANSRKPFVNNSWYSFTIVEGDKKFGGYSGVSMTANVISKKATEDCISVAGYTYQTSPNAIINSKATATLSYAFKGCAPVVMLTVDIQHEDVRDLFIELEDSNGNFYSIHNGQTNVQGTITDMYQAYNINLKYKFGQPNVYGNYTLHVNDTKGNVKPGVLRSMKLHFKAF